MVTAVSPHVVSRTRTGDRRDRFSKIFKHPIFETRNGDLSDVQTFPNFAGRRLGTQGATFIFVPTSKSQRIVGYKFWNKIKIKNSSNFKGVQTFLEKSDKFYKSSSSNA
jgi:hypothetical protein